MGDEEGGGRKERLSVRERDNKTKRERERDTVPLAR
jgi:hypothetical protein